MTRVVAIWGLFFLSTLDLFPTNDRFQLILFINADSILCSFCLNPLLKFNELIKEIDAEEITVGIVINVKENPYVKKKLLLKQISVVLDSINFSFPIVLESEGELGVLREENFILLVINDSKHSTQWMKLTLDNKEIRLLLK